MASEKVKVIPAGSIKIRTEQTPKVDSKTEIIEQGDETKTTIVTKQPTPGWLKRIYDIKLFTAEELAEIYDLLRYMGFNRDLMLYKLERVVGDPKLCVQIIIACALRGPQAASKLKMKNGKTIVEMGITASGKMGTEDISCQRISASTADLAAHYLKILNVPKRLPSLNCPGWLQFPNAGSIKLPQNLRDQHIEFSKEFSRVIGGIFNESIYSQMMANAYLDENLQLFD